MMLFPQYGCLPHLAVVNIAMRLLFTPKGLGDCCFGDLTLRVSLLEVKDKALGDKLIPPAEGVPNPEAY